MKIKFGRLHCAKFKQEKAIRACLFGKRFSFYNDLFAFLWIFLKILHTLQVLVFVWAFFDQDKGETAHSRNFGWLLICPSNLIILDFLIVQDYLFVRIYIDSFESITVSCVLKWHLAASFGTNTYAKIPIFIIFHAFLLYFCLEVLYENSARSPKNKKVRRFSPCRTNWMLLGVYICIHITVSD